MIRNVVEYWAGDGGTSLFPQCAPVQSPSKKGKSYVKRNKFAPDMGDYVAKRDPFDVVSDFSQGVLGLKNLCAQQCV